MRAIDWALADLFADLQRSLYAMNRDDADGTILGTRKAPAPFGAAGDHAQQPDQEVAEMGDRTGAE